MFPEKSYDELMQALRIHGKLSTTAIYLSNYSEMPLCTTEETNSNSDDSLYQPVFSSAKDKEVSLQNILVELSKSMDIEKVKLKVDSDDLLSDALAYFKDPNFEPKKPLKVIYKGQPAADTGGVMKQFFTDLMNKLCETFFQGSTFKVPMYNASIVASSLMKYIGTIIVHSVLQGGPGIPVFSDGVYYYIVSGNVDMAMQMISVNDCRERIKNFIYKVAEAADVSTLDEQECVEVLSECGLTEQLTNDSKMRIIQSAIIHDVISRPKIVLDKLAEGLNTLGFRKKMQEHPKLFKELFVPTANELNGNDVAEVLLFPSAMNEVEKSVEGYLKQFLQKANRQILENFLIFTTGSARLPNFGFGKIKIKFHDDSAIFPSTCLLHLTLPKQFEDSRSFDQTLMAVIETTKKNFNCV